MEIFINLTNFLTIDLQFSFTYEIKTQVLKLSLVIKQRKRLSLKLMFVESQKSALDLSLPNK